MEGGYEISAEPPTYGRGPLPPQVPKHAGWDAPLTEVLPKTRQFPLRPSTAKAARESGVPTSNHAGRPPMTNLGGVGGGYAGALAGLLHVDWKDLTSKLPTRRDPESTARRRALWAKFDINANGLLSLAEVDKAVQDVIKCPALFNSKPAVMRAFMAARRANGVRGQQLKVQSSPSPGPVQTLSLSPVLTRARAHLLVPGALRHKGRLRGA